ncbi:tesmin isoform X2 [Sceloporus undulatus]|uniref:tesmin isoform X2 n=1 Tax=Sceloporus undulatus TaxID=8520 RepID=UPI001C4AFBF7|nr:tesmin isoform X2 [Sceloporus undulatus]
MEGKRREAVEEGEAETPAKLKACAGQLEVSTEVNHVQSESLTVSVEKYITLNGVSRMDNGHVNAVSMSNLTDNTTEERFNSHQEACLISMGETTVDHLKYVPNRENENAAFEVKMQPCIQDYCGDVLRKDPRLPEEISSEGATCAYLPQLQLHSCNIRFPSALMTQHRNSALSLSASTPDGALNADIERIPVLRPLLIPTAGANNSVSYDQIKGVINNSTMLQPFASCSSESCNGTKALSQDAAAVCDELAEVREAVVSITSNNAEEIFQNSDSGENSHNLPISHEIEDGANCSQRNYPSPQVIICQLKNGMHILCLNNTETKELKAVHLVPLNQEQQKYLQPDASNTITSVLGQFLPVVSKLNVSTQEVHLFGMINGALVEFLGTLSKRYPQTGMLDNGAIHTYHSDPNFQEATKLSLVGLPGGSWDAKSKKPCNCTKSQCLKLYCDCFANGDFCSNCNCNNCYNNPQHEIERFNAIKACLDRNPEAFLPKIGKGKLGDIKPRHNKGCNCKRSGCLKNYCECFEAKIMCSSICKCVGCKNYEESTDRRTLINMPNHMEIKSNEGNDSVSFSNLEIWSNPRKDRQSNTCISWEVVEATCACLLAQAEEAEKEAYSFCVAERMILEEFGICLSQILHSEFKSKGLKVE